MAPAQKMTKLDAVNIILASIGEPPTDTIETDGLDAVTFALQALTESEREVQSIGLNCNTRTYTLSPDNEGKIQLPQNTLFVDTELLNTGTDRYAQVGSLIINAETGEDTFDSGFEIELQIVVGLDFDDLPYHVQDYITRVAAVNFSEARLGDSVQVAYAIRKKRDSEAVFKRLELRAKRINPLESPSRLRIWGRTSNPTFRLG